MSRILCGIIVYEYIPICRSIDSICGYIHREFCQAFLSFSESCSELPYEIIINCFSKLYNISYAYRRM